MAQVVPAEIGDAGPRRGSPPMPRIHLPDRTPGIGEYVLALLAHLPLENRDREIVERYAQRLAILGLPVLDRDDAAGEIDLIPGQPLNISLPQPGGEREQHQVLLMSREFPEETIDLRMSQPAHPNLAVPRVGLER
ncbi:hypothetical protein GGR47_002196 [Sphingomonas aquatilis]|uniref:Uncharacterized protein n=1 Tax=Sphingomonas aquatilis TaxID=93063 RepID=A0AAW3TV81_9SPHN|nr:hypothetical protein [Sphingomonas aquatilis]MBB3875950.1 hypothetical protein [Sphingomonas aquatilis]MCI4654434.1 hypothetical protein [Sphingomonas aquatilis]